MPELGKLETCNESSLNDIANHFKSQSNTYPSTVEYKLLEMLCNKVKDLEYRFNKLTESKESPVTNYQNKVIEKIETDNAINSKRNIEAAELLLQSLSNEERAEILCNYCTSCGKYDPECECNCH